MRTQKISCTFALLAATAIAMFSETSAQTCPSYTRKDVVVGKTSDLPAGFFVYGLSSAKGVYKSSLSSFVPSQIPGTGNDIATNLSISSDGTWIAYSSTSAKAVYVVRIDGTGRIKVPTTGDLLGSRGMASGIYYRSPYGSEVFYKSGDYEIRAVTIVWEGGKAVFGRDRIVGKFTGMLRASGAISANHLFCRTESTRFVTIPDAGKGTASDRNIWKHSGSAVEGCEEAMTHDGSQVCFNPGLYGDPACVPQEKGGMWHKGFVVTPFQDQSAPSVTMSDLVMKKALSINWCPPQYRFGEVFEVDFRDWNFGNRNDFVIGLQRGEKSPVHAVWLVRWKDNTWYMLTSNQTKASGPAVFFSSASTVEKQSAPGAVANPMVRSGVAGTFILNGQSIGRQNARQRRTSGVVVPR